VRLRAEHNADGCKGKILQGVARQTDEELKRGASYINAFLYAPLMPDISKDHRGGTRASGATAERGGGGEERQHAKPPDVSRKER
jgi:hypothetical protein